MSPQKMEEGDGPKLGTWACDPKPQPQKLPFRTETVHIPFGRWKLSKKNCWQIIINNACARTCVSIQLWNLPTITQWSKWEAVWTSPLTLHCAAMESCRWMQLFCWELLRWQLLIPVFRLRQQKLMSTVQQFRASDPLLKINGQFYTGLPKKVSHMIKKLY